MSPPGKKVKKNIQKLCHNPVETSRDNLQKT